MTLELAHLETPDEPLNIVIRRQNEADSYFQCVQWMEGAASTAGPQTDDPATAASLQLESGLHPMTSDLSSTEKHLWFIKSCQKT